MLLSIIIVSFNTKDLTLQTLTSVFENLNDSKLLNENTEVWVVDNNSQDDSITELQNFHKNLPTKLHKNFHLILNKENVGFGRANNQAIEKAKGEYIFLLNSDTIVKPHALDHLIQAFQKTPTDERTSVLASQKGRLDKLGILAPTLLNPDGSIQRQGGSFPTLLSLFVHMSFLDDLPVIGQYLPSTQHTGRNTRSAGTGNSASSSAETLTQLDWVGGTAMIIKREVIAEIDPLDPNIFMYGEDVEFCMRAKNHHWDIAITPAAEIIHFGSASSSSSNAIIGEFKGYLYIWSKHKPGWQRPLVKAVLIWGAFLRMVIFGTILGQKEKAHPYVVLLKSVLR